MDGCSVRATEQAVPISVKSLAGQLDDRHVGELADEVTQRVGLPDARRAVEQQTPLEVLSCGEQPLPLLGHPDHLPADRRQNVGGQDDVVGAHVRPGVELQHRTALAEHVVAERDHLAAEDVVVAGLRPGPRPRSRRPGRVRPRRRGGARRRCRSSGSPASTSSAACTSPSTTRYSPARTAWRT